MSVFYIFDAVFNNRVSKIYKMNFMNNCFKPRLALSIVFTIFLSYSVYSVTDGNPYVPSRKPDRINMGVTEDPSTSAAVTWRTSTGVKEAFAEIAVAEGNPVSVNKAERITALTETLITKDGSHKELIWKGVSANYHSVVFYNLKPGTMYTYRVGDGDVWSEWFQFSTTSDRNDSFSFLYFGDAQAGILTMWSKVIRQAYAKAPDAKLMLHGGDLINRSTRDEEWGEWFEAGSFIHAVIPNMPTPGNHDYGREGEAAVLSPFWRAQFTLPENGPKGLEETCYYADIQGVRFISLDAYQVEDLGKNIETQKVWLDSILKYNPNQWTCVILHHPIYSPKATRDNKKMRETFKPLFDKYKVDLVLQGHDHAYTRGMKNIPVDKGESGTMYVVSVSGPKMSDSNMEKKMWMDRLEVYTQLFQVITVDNDELRYRAYTSTGELFDGFNLIKRPGKVNKVVELPLCEN